MSKRNSIILGLLFVILVVEVIIMAPDELGISPEADRPPAPVAVEHTPSSSQVMRDVHLIEAKADGKEWELWADRALGPKTNAEDWTIEQVRVTFFASNGVTYTVTGAKGFVVPVKNDIRIQGNVVTKSSNGYTFKSETIFYDSKARRLTAPEKVDLLGPLDKEGGQLQVRGAELTTEFASNELTVNKNVNAKKKISADKTAEIKSERAVFSGRSSMAHFFGNVRITVEGMTLTGPEARFAYDAKSSALESMDVVGGTRMTDDVGRWATSQSVSVHFKQDKLIFKGAPRVVQNGDELIGDEITLLDGGRKVQVSNAKAQFDANAVPQKN